MAVVHVNAVGLEDIFELVDEGGSRCFYAQNIEDLRDIVGVGFDGVYFWMREAGFQIGALGLEDNVLATLFFLFVELLFGTGSHDNFF